MKNVLSPPALRGIIIADGWLLKCLTTAVAAHLGTGRLFLRLVIVVANHISETECRQHEAHEANQSIHRQHTPTSQFSFLNCNVGVVQLNRPVLCF